MWIGLLVALGLGAIALSVLDDDDTEATSNDETVTDEDGTITGTSGDDTILVDDHNTSDVVAGSGDDDIVVEATEQDQPFETNIYGGEGDDQIDARDATTPTVYGGIGNDHIEVEEYDNRRGSSEIFGGDGDDIIDMYTDPEYAREYSTPSVIPELFGGAGNDTFNINVTTGGFDEVEGWNLEDPSDVIAQVSDFDADKDTLTIDITSFLEGNVSSPQYDGDPTFEGLEVRNIPESDFEPAYAEIVLEFELEGQQAFSAIIKVMGGPFPTTDDINIIQ
jgi:hypothetical protein